MSKIFPILLAGGSGKRLWPLSRESYPKQFVNLVGEETLFQQSALRSASSKIIEFADHITVTTSDFRFIVGEQLQAVGIDPKHILIEPESKNTAASVVAASLFAQAQDPDAILLVSPCDHVISDTFIFHEAVKVGAEFVQLGKMITFGALPSKPETGYGYLGLAEEKLDEKGTSIVAKFIEKPELSLAQKMFDAENYLWNMGIMLFAATDMIAAFERHMPETLRLVKEALETAEGDLGFLRLNPVPWEKLENISIDFGVMEKVQNLVAVPFSAKWSDLGGWDAIWSEAEKNQSGVVLSEGAHAFDCSNCLIRTEARSQQIVGLGLDNIIAVAMPDAVLVAEKNRVQDIKMIVDYLKDQDIPQSVMLPRDYRPWGWFETIEVGDRFKVKRINVKPGASLSLQSHEHRSEHWVVVAGDAKVTIGNEVKMLGEGQSTFVPKQAIHRLENPGKTLMVLIEVQIGSYLGEDDIIRYQDVYARS